MLSVSLGDDPCTGHPSLEAEPFDRVLCCPARSGGVPTPLFHVGMFSVTQICCSDTLNALVFCSQICYSLNPKPCCDLAKPDAAETFKCSRADGNGCGFP